VPAKYKADLDLFKKYADQVNHTNPLYFNVNRVYAHLIKQRAHRPKIEEKQPLIYFAETWLHLAGITCQQRTETSCGKQHTAFYQ